MYLDSRFSDGKLCRNLFIQKAGNDVTKYLLFARGEPSDESADFCGFLNIRTCLHGFFQRAADSFQELLVIARFCQEIDSPFFHGLDSCVKLSMAGKEDNGHAAAGGPEELLLQIHPAQSGHLHIENDAPDAVVVLTG